MAVKDDCRHYIRQTVRGTERLERCRLGANEAIPFACPEGCVFYEPRRTSPAGWQVRPPGGSGGPGGPGGSGGSGGPRGPGGATRPPA